MFGRLPVDIDTEAVHDPDVKLRQYASKLEPNVDEIDKKDGGECEDKHWTSSE